MLFWAVMVAYSLTCSSERCLEWDSAGEMLAILRFGRPRIGRTKAFVSCEILVVGLVAHGSTRK